MLLLKVTQLVVGALFAYMGFEMRIRHNYKILRGFVTRRNYSGLSRGYARRAGRICLYGGICNLVIALIMLFFVKVEDTAPIGTAHYMIVVGFAVGLVGLLLAILLNELYNLRRYGER